MSLSSRTLLTTAALAAAVIAPSAANAAEGFTAVTSTGDVVQLHSDSAPGVTGVHKVTGLAAGESIVGLDRTPTGELLGLTSAGNIASVDRDTGKATLKFPAPVTTAVAANAAVTFAVAPDGASARIITPGRDIVVNLATGAATNGPGLTFAAGDPHAGAQAAPALDYAADGRLIGVDAGQRANAVQTAAGAATLQTLAGVPFKTFEPLRSTVASDGSVWTATNLSDKPDRAPQSRFVSYDPATGKITDRTAFLGVRLDAIADDGPVADDKTPPKATMSGKVLRRKVNQRGAAYWTGLNVKTNEGGQTLASIRLNGKVAGMALTTLDRAGTAHLQFGANRNRRRRPAPCRRGAPPRRRPRDRERLGPQQAHLRPGRAALPVADATSAGPPGPGACAGPHACASLQSIGHMAKKVWVLDTETKGTGANVVPLDSTLRRADAPAEPLYVPPKRAPRPPEPPAPRPPRAYKLVDVTSGEVLAEDVDTRAAIGVLEGLGSVVDVRIYVWDESTEHWVLLTLGEHKALWDYRGKLAPESASR